MTFTSRPKPLLFKELHEMCPIPPRCTRNDHFSQEQHSWEQPGVRNSVNFYHFCAVSPPSKVCHPKIHSQHNQMFTSNKANSGEQNSSSASLLSPGYLSSPILCHLCIRFPIFITIIKRHQRLWCERFQAGVRNTKGTKYTIPNTSVSLLSPILCHLFVQSPLHVNLLAEQTV